MPEKTPEPASMQNSEKASERIPFEPGKRGKKKKAEKKPALQQASSSSRSSAEIPQEVRQRMVRRMALFCGIPSLLGFVTLIISYIVVSRHWFDLPNSAVVLVSMGLLGLGVLGLSYGAISTSWDEGRPGNWWGWQEFKQNFSHLVEAWRSKQPEQESDIG